ncbi:fasciclin domain-containing protein [Leptolyngbya sp. FACHB-541]|uniref:fasciclin domain-containing protein n=1 Tax=Leptolyngbya sp. FACHB-541 TaxID=2692810 RepID=UPI00168A2C34|nr:fasciclin domain-containing protein [Leptolyngbya sp. FACHB-541]MBD1998225.1 fasciclin domain-containing protein [Leptolyngbya sp. FACHB-541]
MQVTFYSRSVRAIAILLGAAGVAAAASAPLLAQTQSAPAPTAPGLTTPGAGTPGTTEPSTTPPTTTPGPDATTPATEPPAAQPVPAPDAATPPTSSNASLTELLQQVSTQQAPSGNSFNTLAQAVAAADVAPLLQNAGGPVTIFAPTDTAFAALPDGALEFLLRPENRNLLRQVLAYHVVPGEFTSSQLQTGAISTLNGGIAVRVTPERIVVNDGSVIRADIQASNGVVHAVNRVLLPPQIRQQLTTALNAQ